MIDLAYFLVLLAVLLFAICTFLLLRLEGRIDRRINRLHCDLAQEFRAGRAVPEPSANVGPFSRVEELRDGTAPIGAHAQGEISG